MSEVTLTKGNFEAEVLSSDIPVLVDFWAEWCGPCKMVGPVVSEIAEDFVGRIKVGKVNVDNDPELAQKYRVTAIPVLKLFKGGEVVAESVGYHPKEEIVGALLGDI